VQQGPGLGHGLTSFRGNLPGAVTFHALTAIWRLPSLFLEEDKMGMIAFYAGLFIGVLWGLLLSSLLAFSLAKSPRGSQPNQAEGYSQVDPQ
jgi:hypothetical protein